MKNLALAVLVALVLPATVLAAGDAEKGKESFVKLCAQCHGTSGLGDGPIGKGLPEGQKPRNLQEPASYKYATSDEKFVEIIKKGSAAVGLGPLMPPQAALSDDQIGDVMAYVKTLQK